MENLLAWMDGYPFVRDLIILGIFGFFGVVSHILLQKYILRGLKYLVRQTRRKWDEILFEQGAFNNLPHLIPALILYQSTEYMTFFVDLAQKAISLWILAIMIRFIDRLLSALLFLYNTFPIAMKRPLKGYVQIVKLFVYLMGGIIGISILIDQSPWFLISGLGALTAVLMLIFQNTILSFIASIQLTGNDLIRVGDWIEMPQYNADGGVVEIALHAIKVKNWDNTITVIPTHKLLDNSFRNWRGMTESGGRRIMRSLFIDQTSVSFCDDSMLERLAEIDLIKEYIANKQKEIREYNQEHSVNSENLVNGRRMTNIGTFRAYLDAYLRSHPGINHQLFTLVRQLEPTPEGLPIQIYAFTKETAWDKYEGVQSDIFDHVLAVVPQFGLRVFQQPSSHDISRIAESTKGKQSLIS